MSAGKREARASDNQTSTFEEILARDEKLVYKTKGTSMLPMLWSLSRCRKGGYKKDDVALYKRGSNTVLHRVVHVKKILRGSRKAQLLHRIRLLFPLKSFCPLLKARSIRAL